MTTKIEWVRNEDGSQGYTINPVKGLCPVGCSFCYARPLYKRFHWNPEIRWWPPAFDLLDTLKKPSRIFVGSTMELFHPSLPENWMEYNQRTAMKYPQHTFIFLTKLPQHLPKQWPLNCWVGVTATSHPIFAAACLDLEDIQATVKFISLEPLLSWGDYPADDVAIQQWARSLTLYGINWLIIGQQTPVRKATMPKLEWIREIVEAADKASVPVFLKDNLACILPMYESWCDWGPHEGGYGAELRQEFPKPKEDK